MIREITNADFDGLMTLYMQLHGNPFPEKSDEVMALWEGILADPNHHIIVADEDGKIVSALSETMISGNLADMLNNLVDISKEILVDGWDADDIFNNHQEYFIFSEKFN